MRGERVMAMEACAGMRKRWHFLISSVRSLIVGRARKARRVACV